MSQSENRAIRPADIIELIRSKGDGQFQARNFRDGPTSDTFHAAPFSDRATVVEPEASPDTKQPVPPPPAPGIPEAEVEHRLNAARAAAKAEGIAEERARLEADLTAATNEMHAARDAFAAAVERMGTVDIADSETLQAALEEAIRRLASERAGSQIDDMPEHFMKRIEAIVDRVSQGIRSVKVRMNAGDFAAIEPQLENSELLESEMISVDLSLGRGDLIIRTDAIRLQDIIAPATDAKQAAPRRSTRSKS
jgi:flagellar assembly protein FliH